MCEYCGCRGVEPIAELMDEHLALLDLAGDLRRALLAGELDVAADRRDRLVGLLTSHVGLEETGVFAALKAQGEYVDEVVALEADHVSLDAQFAGLELTGPDAVPALDAAVGHLSEHIDREDLGIFPVAVVTLGATGWRIVDEARSAHPSFLAT